ncbi:mitochondrial distribution and morphology protein 34 [Coprinopsis sp. MPI-PUGE-AT-0042]|nr:mitochondrial distribution and morphology protein 34 [Coprinopsis sp. MPI-PUGE-AT-0042]
MLAAKQPLVVPMLLRLSHFRLSSYVVLVVSKQKGITIVFKTDPLQNVDINSTFDSIAVIQSFIQREIEGQLRQMFREDLPSIIHRLSQQWVKAKVETPYKKQNQESIKKAPSNSVPRPLSGGRVDALETMSTPDLSAPSPFERARSDIHPPSRLRPPLASAGRRPQSTTGVTRHSSPLSAPPITTSSSSTSNLAIEQSTFPDLEHFDPTYGLRPEGLPTKPIFKGLAKLFAPSKGLADLAEELSTAGSQADVDSDYLSSNGSVSDEEDYERRSYDFVEWGGNGKARTPEPVVEYETIPAIGGGTITRPRIVHAQSQIQAPSGYAHSNPATPSSSTLPRLSAAAMSRAGSGGSSGAATPGLISRNSSNPYFAGLSGLAHRNSPLSQPSSAPPTMAPSSRPPWMDGGKMKGKGPASVYSAQEEGGLYMKKSGAVDRYIHPWDAEHGIHEEEEFDDQDPRYDPRQPYSSQHQTEIDYFSAKAASTSSSPPPSGSRPTRRRLSVSSTGTNRTSASMTSPYRQYHPNQSTNTLDPSSSISNHPDPANIVLRPSLLNNSIHHLSTLSHSNHTLSPYTRSFEHFAVRSGPPRQGGSSTPTTVFKSSTATTAATTPASSPSGGLNSGSLGRSKGLTTAGIVGLGAATSRLGKAKADVAPKARRKRIFRLGGKKDATNTPDGAAHISQDSSMMAHHDEDDDDGGAIYTARRGGHSSNLGGKPRAGPRSIKKRQGSFGASGTEFDEADMDRYFKSMQDAEEPSSPAPGAAMGPSSSLRRDRR